jgi:hypothetical protein
MVCPGRHVCKAQRSRITHSLPPASTGSNAAPWSGIPATEPGSGVARSIPFGRRRGRLPRGGDGSAFGPHSERRDVLGSRAGDGDRRLELTQQVLGRELATLAERPVQPTDDGSLELRAGEAFGGRDDRVEVERCRRPLAARQVARPSSAPGTAGSVPVTTTVCPGSACIANSFSRRTTTWSSSIGRRSWNT